DLERAARVGAGEEVRPDREDVVHLSGADLLGALRLDQVVDAGASAALISVGNLEQLEPRDAVEEPARLLPDPLGVRQMAGVVVRDAGADRMPRREGRQAGEELGDVANFRGELLRARSPFLVLREDPSVLLERRAAAGGVDEDRVEDAALALRLFEARDRV